MNFENIYKSTITFEALGNVTLKFSETDLETKYLVDIKVGDSVIINNVHSNGPRQNVGDVLNNSTNNIGLTLNTSSITIHLPNNTYTQIDVKIKKGFYIGYDTNTLNMSAEYTFGTGMWFRPQSVDGSGQLRRILTVTEVDHYTDVLLPPVENSMLTGINRILNNTLSDKSKLYLDYDDDNTEGDLFAYTDKLINNNNEESFKNKHISKLIEDGSIQNDRFEGNIPENKLSIGVNNSLDLADSAVQNVILNGTSKKVGTDAAFTSLVKVVIGSNEYLVDNNGYVNIDHESLNIQKRITNEDGDTLRNNHLLTYKTDAIGDYGFSDINEYVFKDDNITSANQTLSEVKSYSSKRLGELLNTKVNKVDSSDVSSITEGSHEFMRIKINETGIILSGSEKIEDDNISDILNILDTAKSYQKSRAKRVINNSRATIFFM